MNFVMHFSFVRNDRNLHLKEKLSVLGVKMFCSAPISCLGFEPSPVAAHTPILATVALSGAGGATLYLHNKHY